MKINVGKPSDYEIRQERENRVYAYLERLNIAYEQIDHEAAMTMEDCVKIDAALGVSMCKNLFLCNRQETEFYLLLMPADKPFRTKELSAQIDTARLSFAKEDHMLKLLDIHPGAVSVMGLMNDAEGRVQLLVDEDLLKAEYLGCHPCVNTSSLKLAMKDILEIFLPAVGHEPRMVSLTGTV